MSESTHDTQTANYTTTKRRDFAFVDVNVWRQNRKLKQKKNEFVYRIGDVYSSLLFSEITSVVFIENSMSFVGFQVVTAVIMMSYVFRDIMSRNPFKVNRLFGRTCDIKFKIKPKKKKPTFCLLHASFVVGLFFSLKTEATCSSKT